MIIKNKKINFKYSKKNKLKNKFKIYKIKFKNNFKDFKQIIEFFSKIFIYFFVFFVILILVILIFFIIFKSIYFFKNYNHGFWGFIFGKKWNANNKQFGILKIIISTFFVLLISLFFAIPVTIFSSLFICEYLSNNWKKRIINIVQLLAGIPSVIFGLFSLSILGPFFMLFGAKSTSNLLVTSITLAFMGLPIMISLSVNAIDSVPESYRFVSAALGLSKINTTFKIVLKNSFSKILAAIMLGIARIIGETMAVMIICGNSPDSLKLNNGFFNFIFSSVSTLSSTIGLEILENTSSLHESALYAIGLILFIIVFIINIFVLWIKNFKKSNFIKFKKSNKKLKIKKKNNFKNINNLFFYYINKKNKFKKLNNFLGLFFLIFSTVIVISFTLLIIILIFWKFIVNFNIYDFFSISTYNNGSGIFSTFLVTLLLVCCSILFSFPLSIFVAIYLNEYSNYNSFLNKIIRFIIDLLASTPSIIFGTFGFALFIGYFKMPLSIITSSFTLTIVIIPSLIRSIEESLSNIPDSLRQASFALGSNKIFTIIKIVLPNAFPFIITSFILSIGRIIGESAPVYLTLGTAVRLPVYGFLSPGSSMTTNILMLIKEGANKRSMQIVYESSFLIMLLIFLLNMLALFLSKKFSSNYVKINLNKKIKIYIKKLIFFFRKINFKKKKK